jgi:YcaO-like protein with predicted kinase domain
MAQARPAVADHDPPRLGPWPSERSLTAAQTLARVEPLFPQYGITRLARITGLDSIGIPVWTAVRPNGLTLSVSQGKGIDDDSARVSAAMEALELSLAEDPSSAIWRASPRELEEVEIRTALLPTLLRRDCAPPADDDVLDWLEGFDLATGAAVLVPADAIRVDNTRDLCRSDSLYWQSTDGLAAGNTLGEAVLQGLLERIERDATALWHLRSADEAASCCVDPGTIGDDAVRRMVGAIAAVGLDLKLFDITSNLAIPCFFAVIAPQAGLRPRRHFDVASGAGCHISAPRAAARAIAEAAQSRLTVIAGLRDDFQPTEYEAGLAPDVRNYMTAAPITTRASAERPPICSWRDMLDRLSSAKVGAVLAVPLTSDEPFCVAKVVVEGLENPPGERRTRLGPRAIRTMVRAL